MAKSFASQPITGETYAATSSSEEAAYRPSYSSGYTAQPEEEEEPEGPSLFQRFKETQAYDRLQNELSNLGNRFIEQLSKTGQEVVLPALFLKLKDLIGIDLSGQGERSSTGRQVASTSSPTSSSQSASQGSYAASTSTGTSSQGSQSSYGSSSSGTGGSSYATSENQGYGVEARDREAYRQGQSSADREDYGRGRDRGD
jgi:hypothetical protein